MEERLIIKYLNNQCTPEEVVEVLTWLSIHGENNEGRALLKKVWKRFKVEPDKEHFDQERLLDKIHHEVNLRSLNKTTSLKPVKVRFKQWLIRAAAVLFLPILFLELFTYLTGNDPFIAFKKSEPQWAEISTLAGGKANFQLPDGTNVWLNFESRLRYPLTFTRKMREVELEGEAFFDVAHDAGRPFMVKSGGLGILATGTEFNVMAYPDDETTETTLISGAVTIQKITAKERVSLYEMTPGQYAVLHKMDGKLLIKNVDTENYTAWREGKMVFKDEPIDVVLKRLNRWYNVDFELKDPKLSEYTFNVTLIDETLPQVLELLELAAPIRSKVIPREKLSDGTYSKSRIEIYLKNK